jgi:signal peptidase I
MSGGGIRAIVYCGLLLAALAYSVQPIRLGVTSGESMEPTLKNGQPYLIDTRAYKDTAPRRGEVVVFREKGGPCIKRIIAVGGDTLLLQQIQQDGPDELVDREEEPRLRRLLTNPRTRKDIRLHSLTIPRGCVYVVGDARHISCDSRTYGPVPVSSIMGRVPSPPAPQTWQLAAHFASLAAL